jgi:hypothetical protein
MQSWRPLLTGPLAERAWQVVDEIAAVLAPLPASPDSTGGLAKSSESPESAAGPPSPGSPSPGSPSPEPPEPDRAESGILPGPGLAGGTAGGALFFAYLSRARLQEPGAAGDSESAATLLERATESLASVPLPPDLYGGFSGVAWTAEHLYAPRFADPAEDPAAPAAATEAQTTEEDGAEDPLADIDNALLTYLDRSPWTTDYDLIRGLAGLGVYSLERLPRPGALACLGKIVDRLTETAERGQQGLTWHTSPHLLPDWQRKLFPTGYYNLGVAHGVPAVLALLGATCAAGERLAAAGDAAAGALAARARPLLDEAMRWFLAQRLPPGGPSWFGASFSPEVPAGESRLAWCYGDPGIAAAILVAARGSGEAAWERFAVDLALDAAARPFARSRVRDAGLCHGSAGLAHLFNRLYQETGEPPLAAASRRWFEHVLDFRRPGLGVAGYQAYWVEDDGVTESWLPQSGLLEGVTGIGLALLGGLSEFEPAWDRVMMLSAATPPPPRAPIPPPRS